MAAVLPTAEAAAQAPTPPPSRMTLEGWYGATVRLVDGHIEVPVVCVKASTPPACTGRIRVRLQGTGVPHTTLGLLDGFVAAEGVRTVLRVPTASGARPTLRKRRAVRAHVSMRAVGGGGVEANRTFVPRAPGDTTP